ncbi:MAG: hypothetical protein IKW43_10275 [Bacteroidaceae bacterium]|nr:hypothetical protein [Bacteroidaceae bacterium]
MATIAMAQTSSNSPYTRYGFGELSDQHFGNSKAMGGIAYGLRNGLQVNAANPASYTAVDSLTFIFDAGLSLQNTNFKENGVSTNAKNSSFDYIAMQFRLRKGIGMALGFLPYSTVGYDMTQVKSINKDEYGNDIESYHNYKGEGGLQQVFAGLGFKVFNNLSVGTNFSYLYGDITYATMTSFSNTNAFSSVRSQHISVSSYKLDLGAQYTQKFGEKHVVNLGATYSYGHEMNSEGYNYTETYDSNSTLQTHSGDTISNAFSLPHTYGVGMTYVYDKKLTIGMDYTLQKWSECKYFNKEGQYSDRTKVSLGAEYIPNLDGRKYMDFVRYRMGFHYAEPYAKVNGKEGAREYGVSMGVGLPLFRSRSLLNISGQYVKVSPKVKGMLEENCLRLNIGLTFNEAWFMKYKVE